MSKRTGYNSIFFMTTLSVYLGLVLVGASPTVLAQQAVLTQRLEIQNEFEVEDDLDKNPDDTVKAFAGAVGAYFEELESFLSELGRLQADRKFDLSSDPFKYEQSELVACYTNGNPVGTSKKNQSVNNSWLKPALRGTGSGFENLDFLADCVTTEKFSTGKAIDVGYRINYDYSELSVEVFVKKSSSQRAARLAELFNQAVPNYQTDETQTIIKELSLFTAFIAENDQVFIITRLPRGSLASLLNSEE